jgi:high-affinity K+ transport system ATPase subunit B
VSSITGTQVESDGFVDRLIRDRGRVITAGSRCGDVEHSISHIMNMQWRAVCTR